MTVQVLRDEKFKKEYEVTISAEEIQAEKEAWILANAKDMRIDGFRPGKAPLAVLMKNYGEKAHEKAINKLLKSKHDGIVAEHKLQTAELKNVDQMQQTPEGESYKISFDVPPEFDLVDPQTITVENLQFKLPDAHMDSMITVIQFESGEKTWREKGDDHVIQDDDLIHCGIKIYEKDALIYEDDSLKIIMGTPETNACLTLIQKNIVGHKIGDVVTVDEVKMEDVLGSFRIISGRTVKFVIEIEGIVSAKKAALDVELFEKYGTKTLEEFKAWVTKQAQAAHSAEIELCHKRYIFDALDKAYTFELPADDLEAEYNKVWNQFLDEKKTFEAEGKTHPDMEGKTEDVVKEEYRKVAERRIRLAYILSKTRVAEKIELSAEDIPNYIRKHIGNPESEEVQRWFHYMKANKDFRAMYLEMMLENKIAQVLHSRAKHKNIETTSEDLRKRLISIMPE